MIAKIFAPIKRLLSKANMTKDEISRVVLVGGSSRIPAVKRMLAEFFSDCIMDDEINPQEIVALGAA